jgi:dihydrodipicolinate synthase/N-acetylneuraminate lyase
MEFRGIFTIPCTPFTTDGDLDETSLRREVRFCLECGAHGLVAPVNASEFYTLSDEERRRVVEVVAEANSGRVPFVVGCSAVSAHHAVMLARHAAAAGASAVMAMPPVIRKASGQEIYDYYYRLAEATPLPVIVQDFVAPIGTPMPPELIARMLREIPGVQYVKEETLLGPQVLTRIRELAGEALRGVMGGQGGRHLFNEVARGACGSMPACHVTDLHVALWRHLEVGDQEAARALFARMLPLLNFEHLYAVAAYKEVLRRRGVLATAVCRGAPTTLDAWDLRELDVILAELEPHFTWRGST